MAWALAGQFVADVDLRAGQADQAGAVEHPIAVPVPAGSGGGPDGRAPPAARRASSMTPSRDGRVLSLCPSSRTCRVLSSIQMVTVRPAIAGPGRTHEQDMHDVDYRLEVERTQFANDVAIKVIHYRVSRGMSQAELARMIGMRQPNIARLESGEHEPSLSTLARLSSVLGADFSVEVKRGHLRLRNPVHGNAAPAPHGPADDSRHRRAGHPKKEQQMVS